jgi:hypothetical protein
VEKPDRITDRLPPVPASSPAGRAIEKRFRAAALSPTA